MIVYKQVISEDNLNAVSIQDFYYRNTQYESTGGTGIRGLSRQYLKQGKIIDRRITLYNDGNTLEIITIFKDKTSWKEFMQEELHNEAIEFFYQRNFTLKTETYEILEEISLRKETYE